VYKGHLHVIWDALGATQAMPQKVLQKHGYEVQKTTPPEVLEEFGCHAHTYSTHVL
jgi:hypothetical protein